MESHGVEGWKAKSLIYFLLWFGVSDNGIAGDG